MLAQYISIYICYQRRSDVTYVAKSWMMCLHCDIGRPRLGLSVDQVSPDSKADHANKLWASGKYDRNASNKQSSWLPGISNSGKVSWYHGKDAHNTHLAVHQVSGESDSSV